MPEADRVHNYYSLLPDWSGERLLLLERPEGWALPQFTRTEQHFWQSTDHINAAMRELLGIEVTTLRCVYVGLDEAGRAVRVHELESHSPVWQPPPGARWLHVDDLRRLKLSFPLDSRFMQEWLEARQAPPSPLRVPWATRGWYDEAVIWIDHALKHHNLEKTGHVVQLRAWGRSCVMRVPTNRGDFYFKALPPFFAFEIELVRWLGARYPGNFPSFLAMDEERHWVLMPDFDGQLVSDTMDISVWEDALRHYATIQIGLASEVDRLLALGVPDMCLHRLKEWIDGLVSDDSLLSAGDAWLSQVDVVKLRSLAPALKEICAELDSLAIPPTLEHGDFWPQNIVRRGDNSFLYFDWSDASLTHPFFSMALYLTPEVSLPDVQGVEERLRDAYLEVWTSYAPRDELLKAYELAQTLAPVHIALNYQRNILPNMEHRWEMENMAPYFLKIMLERTS